MSTIQSDPVTGVRFGVLGDVEARVDGRPIDLGHARQRCVLVALLVDANQVVPADHLVERVWADRLPVRVGNALSGYLSRLRHALAGSDARLVRQRGGYLLEVDPMAVDLHRFRHLVAEARAAGDDETAESRFGQALALWRGQAFAALDTPWLAGLREVVEAERLTAELDRYDIALRRGKHAALLAEVAARAAAHPLDERLAGQLMLALYRSGRQADALHHYEQVRRRLAGELGADPSPPLRRLHQQILVADPGLAGSAAPDAAGCPVPNGTVTNGTVTDGTVTNTGQQRVPRQLPAAPRWFTGRTRELAHLDGVLATGGDATATVVISAVSGSAGVGKTALAVRWAHQVADRFPDGQLYVNLRGFDPGGSVMTPAEAMRQFLDALDVPPQRVPADLDAQAALYRTRLAGTRTLVVLDNARDVEQVRPLLPGTPGCVVVVTSRNRLTGLIANEGATPLTLDLLTRAEAHDLLIDRLGPARIAAEPEAAADLVTRCARLPLALTVVAARAATHPDFSLASLAAELRDDRGGLDAFAEVDPDLDLRAVFSGSYAAVSSGAARLFRALGLHPGPDITAPAAASLARVPVARVRPLLAELARAHLVAEHAAGRFTFHDLLKAYAADRAQAHDSPAERRQAVHRLLDHYLHTAYAAALLIEPERDSIILSPPQPGVTVEALRDAEHAMGWLAAEHPVLLAAVHRAAGTGFHAHTWQLGWALAGHLDCRGHWHAMAAIQQVALDAARRLADRPAQASTERSLARAFYRLGRYDDAENHFRSALDLHAALADPAGQARARLNLASVAERQGRYPDALRQATLCFELFQTAGNRAGQAGALNAIGWYHAKLGDHQQALAYCERALTIQQQLGDRLGQAATWDSLGYAYHQLGQHAQAISSYRRGLDLYRTAGYRFSEATILDHMGDAHHAAGDSETAGDVWRRALAILNELDHADAERLRVKLVGLASESHTATRLGAHPGLAPSATG
ncbi:MAG TPA: BTAD domain-containing putative transcriptional regulator [Pilimelia sp.]|nr:BTAD domain-containing putative transcriptional regulator [Pilimelia sp.]